MKSTRRVGSILYKVISLANRGAYTWLKFTSRWHSTAFGRKFLKEGKERSVFYVLCKSEWAAWKKFARMTAEWSMYFSFSFLVSLPSSNVLIAFTPFSFGFLFPPRTSSCGRNSWTKRTFLPAGVQGSFFVARIGALLCVRPAAIQAPKRSRKTNVCFPFMGAGWKCYVDLSTVAAEFDSIRLVVLPPG